MVIHSSLKIGGKLHGVFGKTDEKSFDPVKGKLKTATPSPNYLIDGGQVESEPILPESAGLGLNTFLIHHWQSMVRTVSYTCLINVRDFVDNTAGECQFLHTSEYSIE
jgi:hypothetical protein